ncbi:hypothetical protein C8Q77DRAFT_655464 [Trametes polyzona]|nr:hypothetical protein C8Q77DRAFT_655464 [Trametes polyzona]
MLSSLTNVFVSRGLPTAVIVVGTPGRETESNILHIMPENGTVERYDICFTTRVIRNNGSERSREQIGTIAVPRLGDHVAMKNFLDDIQARALLRWKEVVSDPSRPERGARNYSPFGYIVDVPQLVDDILRPAALDATRAWEELVPPESTGVTEPVYIVHVKRSKPGIINTSSCI